jgi:hypothetical protein
MRFSPKFITRSRGALPASGCKSRVVAEASVELLSIRKEGLTMLPTSLVMASTVFVFPSWKRAPTPVPAGAVVATPNIRAITRASPNIVEAVLPTQATFDAMLLNIALAPFVW